MSYCTFVAISQLKENKYLSIALERSMWGSVLDSNESFVLVSIEANKNMVETIRYHIG